MRTLAILIALASPVLAGVTTQPQDDIAEIAAALGAQNAAYSYECSDRTKTCRITYEGSPTFPDKQAARATLLSELSALEDKMDNGTATVADVRRAIKLILKLVRISKEAP